jgi:hypothetical protein
MSYDVHWFRPAGDAPLLEQARADRPDVQPSPEHDARRQAFVEAFVREFPDAVVKPVDGEFSLGCWFVRQAEIDEDREDESDFCFFTMGVDDALFNRVMGSNFPEREHQAIARLLFEHGFVAWDPQGNRVLTSATALSANYDMYPSGEGNEDMRSGLVGLAIVVGIPLLLVGLALYAWLG